MSGLYVWELKDGVCAVMALGSVRENLNHGTAAACLRCDSIQPSL